MQNDLERSRTLENVNVASRLALTITLVLGVVLGYTLYQVRGVFQAVTKVQEQVTHMETRFQADLDGISDQVAEVQWDAWIAGSIASYARQSITPLTLKVNQLETRFNEKTPLQLAHEVMHCPAALKVTGTKGHPYYVCLFHDHYTSTIKTPSNRLGWVCVNLEYHWVAYWNRGLVRQCLPDAWGQACHRSR